MKDQNKEAFQTDFFDKIEVCNSAGRINFSIDSLDSIKAEFISTFDSIISSNIKTVLGLDIYQYSQFGLPEQILVPTIFDILFEGTKRLCDFYEPSLFKSFPYLYRFIPTGDGGFLILDNLFQAIVFNINFHVMLRLFNSKHTGKEISNFVGEIIIRSCITHDFCYQYWDRYSNRENYYGSAIINNHRILSKDRLNRFLIDHNTYKWFLENFNGIENLNTTNINNIFELLCTKYPEKYKIEPNSYLRSEIFPLKPSPDIAVAGIENLTVPQSNVNTCLVQKIGKIHSKMNEIDVYNIFIQRNARFFLHENTREALDFIIVSVGNLNTAGISEDN